MNLHSNFLIPLSVAREADEPSVSASLAIYGTAMTRDKRCLLAYLFELILIPRERFNDDNMYRLDRVNRLKMLRWEIGSVLPKDIQEHMSGPEVTFFSAYSRLLGSYSASLNLDLTAV